MSLLQRRVFLGQSTRGLGALALAGLLNKKSSAAAKAKGAIELHHKPRIERVIWLVMAGGPSHLETFDYKPKLAELDGKPMPVSITKGQPIAQLQGQQLKCLAPQHKFKKFGKSGQEMCELFPHLGEVADDICIIRSLHTEAINHDPAHTFINTGTTISGRPSMGSWITYGLGSEAKDLPGFVVLTSQGRGGQNQPISSRQWHSGFLPSRFQGVHLRGKGDPVLYLSSPAGVNRDQQRDTVSAIQKLNDLHNGVVDDPEIATRIQQYEMAFQMQASVPGLMDLKQEDKKTLDLYGTQGADGTFGANCLLARRLAERGVRFIQLYHRDWDHHGGIKNDIKLKIEEVDRPLMALIKDLKRTGLFDSTLVVWGGEFGRTPMSQGGSGRDHHMKGFTMWLAGGGIKGGLSYGATDEFGYNAAENVVSVHDLHATMLHLLGINHERFSVKFQGLDARLSGVEPCRVVKDVLA
ncbi:MAG: DUF1501 domain-containing protein [Gemmataceae bacterium]|nr:DUF1501 domain-containing protein [Gemmataceae bacterium]